jgi:hypothetical protein
MLTGDRQQPVLVGEGVNVIPLPRQRWKKGLGRDARVDGRQPASGSDGDQRPGGGKPYPEAADALKARRPVSSRKRKRRIGEASRVGPTNDASSCEGRHVHATGQVDVEKA